MPGIHSLTYSLFLNNVTVFYKSSRFLVRNHFRRNAGNGSSFGHILHYHRTCTDSGIIPYMHIFYNTHIGAYINIIAYHSRCSFVASDSKKLTDVYVIAYHSTAVNNNTYPMTYIKPITYLTPAGNLYAILFGKPPVHPYR